MNPMQILQSFISKGLSPQKIAEQMMGNNPVMANLVKTDNAGDTDEVEKVARNIFKEKGRDFDKEFSEFKNKFNK